MRHGTGVYYCTNGEKYDGKPICLGVLKNERVAKMLHVYGRSMGERHEAWTRINQMVKRQMQKR